MISQTFHFHSELSSRLLLRQGEDRGPWAVLLHGYGQDCSDIFADLEPLFPAQWNVLACNAPYPFYSASQRRLVYSWYFFDVNTRQFLVERQASYSLLENLLQKFLPPESAWVCIGFSQGAYMAPFAGYLASHPPRESILLNGRLRHEDLQARAAAFPVYCLNGEQDKTVEIENASRSAEILRQADWQVDFERLAGQGHDLTPEFLDHFRGRLKTRLKDLFRSS